MARNPVRYLAPVALVATIAGVYVVVEKHVGHGPAPAAAARNAQGGAASRRKTKARFYVVKAGDNLSSISTRTGVSLATLESLNPSLDPNTLQTGQRLRLRR